MTGRDVEWAPFVESLDSLRGLLAEAIRQVRDGSTSFNEMNRGAEILEHMLDGQANRAILRQPADLHGKAQDTSARADPG